MVPEKKIPEGIVMIKPRVPLVKLITGLLYPDEDWFDWTIRSVAALWGEPERVSIPFLFDKTDYYHEIGAVLYRRFISFKGLRRADGLVEWKKSSCRLENDSGEQRRVNIDPGYINGARLVLASTKDHSHRIYIRDGIFAEVTMRYRFKKWLAFDYTFPDFSSGIYDDFLTAVRNDWLNDNRNGGSTDDRKI
jgi:hypothetical protein